MKKITLFIFALLIANIVFAQKDSINTGFNEAKDKTDKPFVLSLTAGTAGFGLEVKKVFSNYFDVRLGGNFFNFTGTDLYNLEEIKSETKATLKTMNAHLFAELGSKWVRLVVGAAYFTNTTAKIDLKASDSYTYENTTVTKEQIGTLSECLSYKGLAAYGGISLFRIAPSKRFNVTLDLGTYYLPKPEAKIEGTGLLTGNSSQTAILQENVNDWRWMPTFQLNFNFKI